MRRKLYPVAEAAGIEDDEFTGRVRPDAAPAGLDYVRCGPLALQPDAENPLLAGVSRSRLLYGAARSRLSKVVRGSLYGTVRNKLHGAVRVRLYGAVRDRLPGICGRRIRHSEEFGHIAVEVRAHRIARRRSPRPAPFQAGAPRPVEDMPPEHYLGLGTKPSPCHLPCRISFRRSSRTSCGIHPSLCRTGI